MSGSISSRNYRPEDRDACLAIFAGNVPAFFARAEEAEFCAFLDGLDADDSSYLVLVEGGIVVACGGLTLDADRRRGHLVWGMVDASRHGRKLGTVLTEARLDMARAMPSVNELALATSQHTRDFYARFGFTVSAVTPDGFGPGLDRLDMVLPLG